MATSAAANIAMQAPAEAKVWYFAYGSNMSTAKFEGSRGIIPQAKISVKSPGWQMQMLIPGLAYTEPAFSALEEKSQDSNEKGFPDVCGVAYLITERQYRQVIASEGGGTAYTNISLIAEPLDERDQKVHGHRLKVVSLGAGMRRDPPGRPSKRYMDLIVTGAKEAELPAEYVRYLEEHPRYNPPESGPAAQGRAAFLALFQPVFGVLEKLTKSNILESGFTLDWIIRLVRMVVLLMWVIHDRVFAPTFGRGDGLDEV